MRGTEKRSIYILVLVIPVRYHVTFPSPFFLLEVVEVADVGVPQVLGDGDCVICHTFLPSSSPDQDSLDDFAFYIPRT